MVRKRQDSDDPLAGHLFWSRRGGRDLSAEVDYDRPCPVCGYSLRGMPLKSRCPECGATAGWAVDDERIAWDARQTLGTFIRSVGTIIFHPHRLARHVRLNRRLDLNAARRFRRINLWIAGTSLSLISLIMTANIIGWTVALSSLIFQVAAIVLWLNAVTLEPLNRLKIWTGESDISRRSQTIAYYFTAPLALSVIHLFSPIWWPGLFDSNAWELVCAIHVLVLIVQLSIASRGLGWLLYELIDMPKFEAHMFAVGWVISSAVQAAVMMIVPLMVPILVHHLLGGAMIVCLGTTPAKQRTMTFASLAIDAVNRAVAVREYASGKSINAARVIHTLGEKCVATGFLGEQSGEFCKRDLDAVGMAHDFVPTSAATRTCITLVDRAAGTATELVEEANPVSAQEVDQLLRKLGELLRGAKVVVLSGTLAPGCGVDFYARCLRLAQTMRVKTIVDARGEPLKKTLANRPTVVKPNRSELAATVGRVIDSEQSLLDAIRQIIEMGAMSAIVTNGPGETIVGDGKSFWKILTPRVQVVSPIGSGDALAGGVGIGLLREMPLGEAARLGVACGAANAMTDSAGMIHVQDVEQLRKIIECVPI